MKKVLLLLFIAVISSACTSTVITGPVTVLKRDGIKSEGPVYFKDTRYAVPTKEFVLNSLLPVMRKDYRFDPKNYQEDVYDCDDYTDLFLVESKRLFREYDNSAPLAVAYTKVKTEKGNYHSIARILTTSGWLNVETIGVKPRLCKDKIITSRL